jgi:hypothetical protein
VKYGPSRLTAVDPLGYGQLDARGWVLIHPVMLATLAIPSDATTLVIASIVPSGFELVFWKL